MMMKAALLFLGLAFFPPPAAAEPEAERLARFFDEVAFGAEMEASHAARMVAKWEDKVAIGIKGRFTREHGEMLVRHLKPLAELTKLKFDVFGGDAHRDRHADIDIVFLNRADLPGFRIPGVELELQRRMEKTAGCYFVSFRKPEHRIVKAVVVIGAEQTRDRIDHCLLEEMIQVLGLPGDSDGLKPSVFNERDGLTEYSRIDRILLATLYDPRLAAGTPREPAVEIARGIISELLDSGQ